MRQSGSAKRHEVQDHCGGRQHDRHDGRRQQSKDQHTSHSCRDRNVPHSIPSKHRAGARSHDAKAVHRRHTITIHGGASHAHTERGFCAAPSERRSARPTSRPFCPLKECAHRLAQPELGQQSRENGVLQSEEVGEYRAPS